jgi:hypothetical protein
MCCRRRVTGDGDVYVRSGAAAVKPRRVLSVTVVVTEERDVRVAAAAGAAVVVDEGLGGLQRGST